MILLQRFVSVVVELRDQDLIAVGKALRHRKRGCMMKSVDLCRHDVFSFRTLANGLFNHVSPFTPVTLLFSVLVDLQLKLQIRQNVLFVVSVLVSQFLLCLFHLQATLAWLVLNLQANLA